MQTPHVLQKTVRDGFRSKHLKNTKIVSDVIISNALYVIGYNQTSLKISSILF